MSGSITIDGASFYAKVERLYKVWADQAEAFEVLVIILGKVQDDTSQKKTQMFHTWLM